jgi:hypothetical protein
MDINSGQTTGKNKGVSFGEFARSNTGSDYPTERPDRTPGNIYRKKYQPPSTIYDQPVTKDLKEEFWTSDKEYQDAKIERNKEGGPRVHLLDDPRIVQALNNTVLNTGIQDEITTLRRLKRSWRYIAEVFLSRLGSLTGLGTKEDIRNYQVLYFKLLNLIPSGLLEDPHHDMEDKLIQAIDSLGDGNWSSIGRARRKTRGRKKLRKTIRKSKQ